MENTNIGEKKESDREWNKDRDSEGRWKMQTKGWKKIR